MGFLRLSWPFYAITALALALVLVGWLYKKELHYSAQLEVANSSYQAAIVSYQDEVHKKEQACTITDKTIVELEEGKSVIQTKTEEVNSKLDKLKSNVFKAANAPATKEKITHEQIEIMPVLPDDGRLSDAFHSLLQQSYCSVETQDLSCNNP